MSTDAHTAPALAALGDMFAEAAREADAIVDRLLSIDQAALPAGVPLQLRAAAGNLEQALFHLAIARRIFAGAGA